MQHPKFLATLVKSSQGKRDNGNSLDRTDAGNDDGSASVTPAAIAKAAQHRDLSPSRSSRASSSSPNADQIMADVQKDATSDVGVTGTAVGGGAGSGGTAGGGCFSGHAQAQGRNRFAERLPRSEEACA